MAFGKPLLDNQYMHFRLAELQTELDLVRRFFQHLIYLCFQLAYAKALNLLFFLSVSQIVSVFTFSDFLIYPIVNFTKVLRFPILTELPTFSQFPDFNKFTNFQKFKLFTFPSMFFFLNLLTFQYQVDQFIPKNIHVYASPGLNLFNLVCLHFEMEGHK